MITTFLNMRTPGMTLFKVPLFCMVNFCHSLADTLGAASFGGCDHNVVDRP